MKACYSYQRARLNILQKQLDDGAAMRKQLVEQVHDLQKQLKAEREDSKNLKKRYAALANVSSYESTYALSAVHRISSLEIELKRTSTRRTSETATSSAPSAEALHQVLR